MFEVNEIRKISVETGYFEEFSQHKLHLYHVFCFSTLKKWKNNGQCLHIFLRKTQSQKYISPQQYWRTPEAIETGK